MDSKIEIYQSADSQTQIEVKFENDTVWLSQKMMSELFEKDSDTIGLHLKNIFAEGELVEDATTGLFPVVQTECKHLNYKPAVVLIERIKTQGINKKLKLKIGKL
jgi:hypothetical protein